MEVEKSLWPWCLLRHGWLPLLSGRNGGSPWAEDPAVGAGNLLECALGRYTSGLLDDWQLPVGFDAEGAAENAAAAPDVWTGLLGQIAGGTTWTMTWGHACWVLPWFLFCACSFAVCAKS